MTKITFQTPTRAGNPHPYAFIEVIFQPPSIIDTEVAVESCHRQIGLFDVRDLGQRGAGREVLFEFIHRVALALGHHFNAPVRHVANLPQHVMAPCGAHDEEAKAHTLNNAGDQKSSGDHRRIKTQRAKGRRKVSVRTPCCQLAYSSSVCPLMCCPAQYCTRAAARPTNQSTACLRARYCAGVLMFNLWDREL